MMDIVERLHKVDGPHRETARQAAIEIEILRIEKAEAVRQRNANDMQRMIDYWGQRAEKAEAEIKRLTATLEPKS